MQAARYRVSPIKGTGFAWEFNRLRELVDDHLEFEQELNQNLTPEVSTLIRIVSKFVQLGEDPHTGSFVVPVVTKNSVVKNFNISYTNEFIYIYIVILNNVHVCGVIYPNWQLIKAPGEICSTSIAKLILQSVM